MRIDPNDYFAFPVIAAKSLWSICTHCKENGIGNRVLDCKNCLGTRTSVFNAESLPKWISDVIDRRNLPLSLHEWVNTSWGIDSIMGKISFCIWVHTSVADKGDYLYPESDILHGMYSDFMRGHHNIYDVSGNIIGKWHGGRYTALDNGKVVYTSDYADAIIQTLI